MLTLLPAEQWRSRQRGAIGTKELFEGLKSIIVIVNQSEIIFFCTFLIGVLQKHNDHGSKQAIIGTPYPVVFLVKAHPHPLKPDLTPLPPAYYDPKHPLPPSEPLQPLPWDPNLDQRFGMPTDLWE